MKLAVVVHRYGADINGGSELHARYLAERLASHAEVRVLTTCARDYVTWRNELAPGVDSVNGIPVERFEVARERNTIEFSRRSTQCFDDVHSLQDELRWLDSEGPTSPALIRRLRTSRGEFDAVLLFSVRYYQAYHGARAVPHRAVLVPTAEREPSIGLRIFGAVFRGVRAIMYNSLEEQALINAVSSNAHVPGTVVGIGANVPCDSQPARARQKFGLSDPFVLYVGRIDSNKGCAELFDGFRQYLARSDRAVDLVLVGRAVMSIPQHPRIRYLGFVEDDDKFDLLSAAAVLVAPSPYESLSMAALEAWALQRPVLANAACDVLVGHCLRSNAGLFYANPDEFSAALDLLLDDENTARTLGTRGREYFLRHYSWPAIEQKYLTMFERLRAAPPSHTMEPLPGWFARRRRTVPPATSVVNAAPSGAVVPTDGT